MVEPALARRCSDNVGESFAHMKNNVAPEQMQTSAVNASPKRIFEKRDIFFLGRLTGRLRGPS